MLQQKATHKLSFAYIDTLSYWFQYLEYILMLRCLRRFDKFSLGDFQLSKVQNFQAVANLINALQLEILQLLQSYIWQFYNQ